MLSCSCVIIFERFELPLFNTLEYFADLEGLSNEDDIDDLVNQIRCDEVRCVAELFDWVRWCVPHVNDQTSKDYHADHNEHLHELNDWFIFVKQFRCPLKEVQAHKHEVDRNQVILKQSNHFLPVFFEYKNVIYRYQSLSKN